MERRDRTSVATLYWPGHVAAGEVVALDGDALQHAIVRRLRVGDAVRLTSGRGRVAQGSIARADKRTMDVRVEGVVEVPGLPALEVLAPVGDRDRMLWAAEKCVEHQISVWRPVSFARSQSVAGRGEGPKFADKVRARMVSALEQSGGAWLPTIEPEASVAHALAGVKTGTRVLLDASGTPFTSLAREVVAISAGPEGGLEAEELRAARDAGWVIASLGSSTLRFETAIATGVGLVRAMQHSTQGR